MARSRLEHRAKCALAEARAVCSNLLCLVCIWSARKNKMRARILAEARAICIRPDTDIIIIIIITD